jgi:hypothetical protein
VAAYRVVEICAGAGGQSLGLELAGFEHELSVELDPGAVATLRHNRPHWKVAVGDVASPAVWDPAEYTGIGLLAGGVPCPPFTIAGKQLGATDERDLFAWAIEFPVKSTCRTSALLGRAATRSYPWILKRERGGTTRKHVRNDAGTRTSESVMCKFMGQPVVDIRILRSRRLLGFGVPWPGCRTRVLTVSWPSHLGRSRA